MTQTPSNNLRPFSYQVNASRAGRLAAWDGSVARGTELPVPVDLVEEIYDPELRRELSSAMLEIGAAALVRSYRWLGYDHDVAFTGAGPSRWIFPDGDEMSKEALEGVKG